MRRPECDRVVTLRSTNRYATLAARRLADGCSGACRDQCFPSMAVVLVVAAPPEAGLVATERRAVEPLVHAPEAVQAARVRGVRVVHDAILEHERAHAGPFVPVGL